MPPFIGFNPMPLHLALLPLHCCSSTRTSVETVQFIECAIRQLWSVDHSVDFGPAGPQSHLKVGVFRPLLLATMQQWIISFVHLLLQHQSQIVHVSDSNGALQSLSALRIFLAYPTIMCFSFVVP